MECIPESQSALYQWSLWRPCHKRSAAQNWWLCFYFHGEIYHGCSRCVKHHWSNISCVCSNVLSVVALYSKTGGKNGKHTAVTDSSNISAVSYIGVQVFKHMYGHQFHVIPKDTVPFLTKQFALLLPISFLCSLSSLPVIPLNSNHLELPPIDISLFHNLQAGHGRFKNAMALFRKWKQADLDEGEDEW